MEPQDAEHWFRDPNDGAYEKTEERTGPPLEYVAEKLRRNLEVTHNILAALKSPSDTESESSNLSFQAATAFRSSLIAYLALQNLLALIDEGKLFDRVEAYSRQDFSEWLDRIDRQGSLTG